MDKIETEKRIKMYEQNGWWDKDINDDPPTKTLTKVDYLNKKISSKIKTTTANFIATRFFNNMVKTGKVAFNGATGLENLDNFKSGAIVTCNHCSPFDNFAVLLGLKKHFKKLTIYKIIREGNYVLPGNIGFFMRNCNTLPLSSNLATMKDCMRAVDTLLAKNKLILIYPEQSMWNNYRKPRPLKSGAFKFAAKNNAPVIPTFLTMKDCDTIDADGFAVQEFTLHILPIIYPDKDLSVSENCERMKDINYQLWVKKYEEVYGEKLVYEGVAQ